MRFLLLVLALAVCYSFTPPCPTNPQPLRKLVKGSQVIIEGLVLKTAPLDPDKDSEAAKHWSHKVSIQVITVLQGKAAADTIEVFYSPDMVCPIPDRYIAQTRIIAFLDRVPKTNGFYTHALSYGVKALAQPGLEVYKQRIREMQGILQQGNEMVQKEQTINWLVKCAQDPATRLEGTYELTPGTYFQSTPGAGQDDIKVYNLKQEQKASLFQVLIKTDTLTYSELGLIDLVWNYDNDQLVKLMSRQIRLKSNEWFAGDLMKRINAILADPRLDKIIEEYESTRREDKNTEKKQRKILKDFITLL
jgi:hypothetical protein